MGVSSFPIVKPGRATVDDVPGISCTCGFREPHTESVQMKQNGSWRALLGQNLLLTSPAPAPPIVHWVHAGDGPFHLATEWNEILFRGHG